MAIIFNSEVIKILKDSHFRLGYECLHRLDGSTLQYWFRNKDVVLVMSSNDIVMKIRQCNTGKNLNVYYNHSSFDLNWLKENLSTESVTVPSISDVFYDILLVGRPYIDKLYQLNTLLDLFDPDFRALFENELKSHDIIKEPAGIQKFQVYRGNSYAKYGIEVLYYVAEKTNNTVLLKCIGSDQQIARNVDKDLMSEISLVTDPVNLMDLMYDTLRALHEIVNVDELKDTLDMNGYDTTDLDNVDMRGLPASQIIAVGNNNDGELYIAGNGYGTKIKIDKRYDVNIEIVKSDNIKATISKERSLRKWFKDSLTGSNGLAVARDMIGEFIYKFNFLLCRDELLLEYLRSLLKALENVTKAEAAKDAGTKSSIF